MSFIQGRFVLCVITIFIHYFTITYTPWTTV